MNPCAGRLTPTARAWLVGFHRRGVTSFHTRDHAGRAIEQTVALASDGESDEELLRHYREVTNQERKDRSE